MSLLARLARWGGAPPAAPQLALGWRGLAWKTSGRPTREELMSGSRRGWNIRRQQVPARLRIPSNRWKIVVGDEVEVIAELSNDFGKRGKVLEIRPLENRVVVSDVNLQKKNLKATESSEEARTEQRPGPIHYSNVHLIDPETGKPTRAKLCTEITEHTEAERKEGKPRKKGKRIVRVAVGTNVKIPYPQKRQAAARPTKEDSPFDTSTSVVHEVTYGRYDQFREQFVSRPYAGA